MVFISFYYGLNDTVLWAKTMEKREVFLPVRQTDLDIDLLRCFVAVVESNGFTAASKRLLRTQSAVSIQIKKLEERIGQKLFERDKRAIGLTEHGEILLGYARRMLRLNDETVQRFVETDVQGVLRLGIVEYLAPHRLPDIISKLRSLYRHLDLRLRIDLSSRLLTELEMNNLDVVIAAQDENMPQGIKLFEEELCWAAGSAELPDPTQPLPLAFLPPPCFYREAATQALEKINRPWFCAVTTMNIAGVQAAVNAGLAVGVLSRTSVLSSMKVLGPDNLFPQLPKFDVAVFTNEKIRNAASKPIINDLVQELNRP